jgi:hypothetical protein
LRREFSPFLKKYIFFFSVSVSPGAYLIMRGETSGVLLNLLGALGDVAKLLHLGIHDTFRHVLLTEGLGEFLPRDTP